MRWWRGVVAQEFRQILAYRTDFWVTFIGQTVIQLVIARALWQSIFDAQGVTEMKGFTLGHITLYYILAPIGSRLLMGQGFGFMARDIYEGTFSKYLLYPLSFVQYKGLSYLTNSVFYSVQLIIISQLYYVFFQGGFPGVSTILNLLSGTALFFLASTAYLFLTMAVELISLWADNVWSLQVMLRFFTAFFGGGTIPLVFYPEWGLKIIKFTPFPYLVSLPIRTIMGDATRSEIIEGIFILGFWACVFRLLVFFVWKAGEKRYTGVGQ